MLQLLHSEIELVVKSGYIYVPLLLDPDIAREVHDRSDTERPPHEWAPGNPEPVLDVEGRSFIRSLMSSWSKVNPLNFI